MSGVGTIHDPHHKVGLDCCGPYFSCILSSKVTAPQDAQGGLMLQVYLGSNTLEFSEIFVSRLVHCHLATRPEVESLRVQSSVVS